MMATLRGLLSRAGFDFDSGRILFQGVASEDVSPGWACDEELIETVEIDFSHPILDKEFGTGYGGPEMPRFYAKDKHRIYHPSQYDGATGIVFTEIEFDSYVGTKKPLPYPGG